MAKINKNILFVSFFRTFFVYYLKKKRKYFFKNYFRRYCFSFFYYLLNPNHRLAFKYGVVYTT